MIDNPHYDHSNVKYNIDPENKKIDLTVNVPNLYIFGNLDPNAFIEKACKGCEEIGVVSNIAVEYYINGIYKCDPYCNSCFNKEFLVIKK